MNFDLQSIADRLTGLRKLEGYSQEDMAKKLGISVEEYEIRESGEGDFSVTFLSNCAQIFGIDLMEIMVGEKPKLSGYSLVRSGKGLPFTRRTGFSYRHLAPVFKDKDIEPFLVTSAYSTENEDCTIELSSHSGQEMDYILCGKLKFVIMQDEGPEEFILEEGDTIYYDSSLPHGMISVGGEDCKFLAILHVNEK
jgi:DNA-binding XRE family transcriptional regulator